MRNHYLLAGVSLALLVAVTVIVVGVSMRTSSPGAAAGSSLPPGHPTVSADPAGKTPPPATDRSDTLTIAELEKASAQKPRDVTRLLKLGDACFRAQRYDEAGVAYRKALLAGPDDGTAAVRLAMVWHAQGDSERAGDAIAAVIAEDPRQQEAHYSLAIVFFSQNKVEEAESEWAAAAKIDPTSTIGRRSRSFVDLLQGRQSASPEDKGEK